ncbi:ATP-binding protein [Musicola paradisiaca]|uniref:histidine kinase n=1 Tax=Musicola paradisiaca (strain Ech703) TaxID=579405 RepID=C6CD87_MUSP7|nr:ATP-binding protein [Musicola paradisiaca]ACS86958.1 histidine kinase [Musicola paradisiaca Ech703]
MHGRLFWKILLGLWLTFFLISQLLWVGFSFYGERDGNQPPEVRLGRQVIALQLSLAVQALHSGGMAALSEEMSSWPEASRRYISIFPIDEDEDFYAPEAPEHDLLMAPMPPPGGEPGAMGQRPPPDNAPARNDGLSDTTTTQVVQLADGQRYLVRFNVDRWRHDLMPDRGTAPVPFFLHLPPPMIWLGGLGGLLFSWLMAWNLTRPLSQLRGGFDRVSQGDLSVRLFPAMRRRHDEISDVARDFDAMAGRLAVLVDAREQLLHDVSHELRSPLARLQLAIGLARQNQDNVENSLQRIEREAERMDKMIGELLTLSRAENAAGNNEEYFDLLGLVNAVVNDARYEAQVPGVHIVLSTGEYDDYTVKGAAELIRRALDNIVRNALRFSGQGMQVSVMLSRSEHEWTIGVADQGPGVEESKLSSIFDPFMRIDSPQSGKGYGLGLAIARKAVLAHGGRIEAENRESGGLLIRICLPIWQSLDN